jgi:glycosyltransferase involved in cell wall biosynthesis
MGTPYDRIPLLTQLSFYKSRKIVKRKLVVSFLDRVAPKNKLQIDVLHESGYQAGFFVSSYHASSERYFEKGDFYQLLKPGLVARLSQIFSFLIKYRKQVHHLEVYPGGRFAFIYVLLAKLFSLKVICVERGDLCYLITGGYDRLTRFSMRQCYRWSDLIWYREVYMKPVLEKMGYASKLFFLHNAVETAQVALSSNNPYQEREIDFLWVNRLTPERRSDWLVRILSQDFFKNTHNILAGFQRDTLYNKDQEYVKQNCPGNLHLQSFVEDPSDLYAKARFFVLPAEFVFANNALLEAMSYGVVPLIVKKPGFELLVEDGVSGYVSEYSESAFKAIMEKALHMDELTFKQMSEAAKTHVNKVFSRIIYKEKLIELYQLIKN